MYAIQQTVLALTGMDSGGISKEDWNLRSDTIDHLSKWLLNVSVDLASSGTLRCVLSGSYPVRSYRKDDTNHGIIQGISTKNLYFDTTFIYVCIQVVV